MQLLLHNAKALFLRKVRGLGAVFCKIQICRKLNHLIVQVVSPTTQNIYKIEFDTGFIDKNQCIDPLYFYSLLHNIFLAHKNRYEIVVVLPEQWVLHGPPTLSSLPFHHLEREAILYFQHNKCINVCEYEYYFHNEKQCYFAVDKQIIKNILTVFKKIKLAKPVQFTF